MRNKQLSGIINNCSIVRCPVTKIASVLVTVLSLFWLTGCQEDRIINATDRTIQGTWKSDCSSVDEVATITAFDQETLSFHDGQYNYTIDLYEDSNCTTPLTGLVTDQPDENLFGDYSLYNNRSATIVTPSGLTAHHILFEEQGQTALVRNIIAVIDNTLYLGNSLPEQRGASDYPEELDITNGFRK